MTYLEARKENFYKIEENVDGKKFVTARGWSDLSHIIKLYEANDIEINIDLISQYLQDTEIAKDFANYYDLFNKYKSDYQIGDIISGNASEEIKTRAKNTPFDERLSLLGLLLDQINREAKQVIKKEDKIIELRGVLKEIKEGKTLKDALKDENSKYKRFLRMGVLTSANREMYDGVLQFLQDHEKSNTDFAKLKADYEVQVEKMKNDGTKASNIMNNIFAFVEEI